MKKRIIVTSLVACILVAGCVNQSPEEPEEPVTIKVEYQFAPYTPVPVTIAGAAESYPFDPDNLDRFPLAAAQIQAITAHGFVVVPAEYDQFHDVYKSCYYQGIPVFVTTDSLLHTYHILYDYTLRILEAERFYTDLTGLTQTMITTSMTYYNQTGDEAALKNVAYFCVAAKLLDNTVGVPPEVQDLVEQELTLIEKHQGFEYSPIFGYKEDYSQYVPRGHYTRSESLEKYFKAMMWYGRIMFRLKSEEETKQALYIVTAIRDTSTLDLWDTIYEPTVFFVGKSDDLNIFEYNAAAENVYGVDFTVSDLQDAQKLDQFIEIAKKLRDPRINSSWVLTSEELPEETKGFRFMGQRFIPDSYMFQQLVHDKVGGRLFPKGLDVMAVLGSERALYHLESEKQYANYEAQMTKLREEFSNLDESVWTQNLYWTWLYCLLPLLQEKGSQYPVFMQSDAWADKELNTALGSWTELRHDTILYAKQSYVLTSLPSLTKGYVEPNPYVYARLASLARMMREGLNARGLLLPEYSDKLETLEKLLFNLKTISEKELSGELLTEDEYRTIWQIGFTLESLIRFGTAIEAETDDKVAIIADVHTNVDTGSVLEEAVGNVFTIYVVIKVEGRIFVAKGGVFSYYEFTWPMGDRLTDEQWQKMLTTDPKPLPEWTQSFIID